MAKQKANQHSNVKQILNDFVTPLIIEGFTERNEEPVKLYLEFGCEVCTEESYDENDPMRRIRRDMRRIKCKECNNERLVLNDNGKILLKFLYKYVGLPLNAIKQIEDKNG